MSYKSLNTSFQEKTTCRLTLFQSGGDGITGCPHALQKKATREVMSKVVREIASCMRPGLTLGISTLASIRLS